MTPPLHIVKPDEARPTETVAQRIRRLQAEAKTLARDHVCSLIALMVQTQAVAEEIAAGGGAYHPGAQERARQIATAVESQRVTLEQIAARAL